MSKDELFIIFEALGVFEYGSHITGKYFREVCGIEEIEVGHRSDFDAQSLKELGFAQEEILAANDFCCGTMTVEDAHLACLHCQIGNVAYRVGDTLIFDSESERFVDCEAGNKMMTRDYREGFEVPEIV